MSVLQDDSNLALDCVEVQTDPITGIITVKLKEGISYEPGRLKIYLWVQ